MPVVTRFSVVFDGRELSAALALAWASPDAMATADLDAQASRWLRGDECDRYARFAVEHARRDFLAGRAAAKTAVQALAAQTRAADWEIVRGIWHQPCLRGPAGSAGGGTSGLSVTLAHAGGLGLAVAHDDRWLCGIDVETRSREAESAIESQVSAAEASWARSAASPDERNTRWLLLWTAREAQGKLLRTGLLLSHACAPTANWTRDDAGESWRWSAKLNGCDSLGVRAVVTAKFVVAFVAPTDASSAAASQTVARAVQRSLG